MCQSVVQRMLIALLLLLLVLCPINGHQERFVCCNFRFSRPMGPSHKKRVASRYFDDYSPFVVIVFFKHTQPKHKSIGTHTHTHEKQDLRDEFEHWNQNVYICMIRKCILFKVTSEIKMECARFCDASHFVVRSFFKCDFIVVFRDCRTHNKRSHYCRVIAVPNDCNYITPGQLSR